MSNIGKNTFSHQIIQNKKQNMYCPKEYLLFYPTLF